VHARVTNTGSRAGSEVAQLYLGDPATASEPPRQLRGFDRVQLAPGQTREITLPLTARDLAYWNGARHWSVVPGLYRVYFGDSSALAGLPLRGSFHVGGLTIRRHQAA
jgi:beta-glucosidase